MKKFSLTIKFIICIFFIAIPFHAHADFWTLRTTSEENTPLTCLQNHLMTGIHCTGRYCDNIRLQCSGHFSSSTADDPTTIFREWKAYVSEESPDIQICDITEPYQYSGGSGGFYGFITGLACKGRYCDNISLECSGVSGNGPDVSSCYWSPWVSEENGGKLFFPHNYYAVGIECNGRYCDNKRFILCKFVN